EARPPGVAVGSTAAAPPGAPVGSTVARVVTGSTVVRAAAGSTVVRAAAGSTVVRAAAGSTVVRSAAGSTPPTPGVDVCLEVGTDGSLAGVVVARVGVLGVAAGARVGSIVRPGAAVARAGVGVAIA